MAHPHFRGAPSIRSTWRMGGRVGARGQVGNKLSGGWPTHPGGPFMRDASPAHGWGTHAARPAASLNLNSIPPKPLRSPHPSRKGRGGWPIHARRFTSAWVGNAYCPTRRSYGASPSCAASKSLKYPANSPTSNCPASQALSAAANAA